jgi:hypothetical protein
MNTETLALYASTRPGQLPPDAPVSCVGCQTVFAFGEITLWVDGDETPVCPRCNIDFVVPGALSAEALARAHEDAFGLPSSVSPMTPEVAAAFAQVFGVPGENE